MGLLTTKVPRSLEAKTRLFGFELGDLLIVFLYLASSNLVFGQTKLKFLFVWAGTLLVGGVLYFMKRGKPDQHLQHWGEFHRSPGILTAGKSDSEYQPYFLSESQEDSI